MTAEQFVELIATLEKIERGIHWTNLWLLLILLVVSFRECK